MDASEKVPRPQPAAPMPPVSRAPGPGATARRAGPAPAPARRVQLRPSGARADAAPLLARPSAVPARAVLDVLRDPGQPLGAPVREEMEARLGADFSDVRLHADAAARASAVGIGARAYTSGSHVVIGDGSVDKHTLAHELFHVIQQRQGPVAGADHGDGFKMSDPSDVYEKAAEANAAQVMHASWPGTARRLTGKASARPVVVQRLAINQARQIALTRPNVTAGWYDSVCRPALSVIASRQGQTLAAYLHAMTAQDFAANVDELRQDVRSEPRPLWDRLLGLFGQDRPVRPDLQPSTAYPGYQRYRDTNLLIADQDLEQSRGTPSAALQQFIQDYQAGHLVWYRGIGISHFSWETLQAHRTLASEGVADNPTFTMGNANPTRWIPGVYDVGITAGLAVTVTRDQPVLLDLLQRNVPFPSGAVVRMQIGPATPVAWINDGEQVVRGPIPAASLSVYAVHVYEAGVNSRWTAANLNDLPPAAPYGAGAGPAQINNWTALATAWVNAHHAAAPPGLPGI